MKEKVVVSVSEAVVQILSQFGIQEFRRGNLAIVKETVKPRQVAVLLGLSKSVRGNIVYSMCESTARNIASKMMMGMPVDTLDDMAKSAIAELTNMITGHAASLASAENIVFDISPPNVVIGENMSMVIGGTKTILLEVGTEAGQIDLYFGLDDQIA